MKNISRKSFCFSAILSLLGTMGFKNMINQSGDSLSYSNSITAFLLFSIWLYALVIATGPKYREKILPIIVPCFIFMLCFSGSMVAGVQLDNTGNVDFTNWELYLSTLFVALAASPILAVAIRKLEDFSIGNSGHVAVRSKKSFIVTWGILFLSYIPTLLASFPGFFTYDAEAESYMVFTEKYSTYQPLLHVLLLGWTLRIIYHFTQSYNAGIFVYTLVQMLVLSACFSYEISFLRNNGVKRWICNLGTMFLALFPTVSMFVCCSTKDTLFSGGVILFTTLLLELAKNEELFWSARHKKVLLSVSMLFILFLRNNGIYALVLFLLFFAFVYRKTWKKWLPTVTITFLVFIVSSQALIFAFHAKKGPLAEMFCVPMQQLARVYIQAEDTFTEEDAEILYSLIPQVILDDYNPKLADMVKRNFLEDNFKSSPGKYISLWFRTGIKHFDIYVNSFLENTYGYWYPDTIPDGYRGIWAAGRQYEDSSYFAFGTELPGERTSFLPPLERFYEKISLEIYQQRVPVISMLFSIGFWHWVYIFAALFLLVTRHKKQAFALSLIGLLYLTVLLGPIALVRYVLYLFFAVPLVMALLFDPVALCSKSENP